MFFCVCLADIAEAGGARTGTRRGRGQEERGVEEEKEVPAEEAQPRGPTLGP